MTRHFKPLCSGTTQSFQHQPHSLSHQLRHQIQMLWMIFFPNASPMQATATVGKCQMYLIVWSLFQHTVTNWKVKLMEERGMTRLDQKVLKRRQVSKTVNIRMLLYSWTFTQLNRDCHWLILGHVALTKIKCIPIVIH